MTVLKTITVGTCVSIQGIFVRTQEDGKIVVRVGEKLFTGSPVGESAAA